MKTITVTLLLLAAVSAAAFAPTAAASPPTCSTSPNNHHNVGGYADCVEQCLNGDTFQVWPLPSAQCY